MTAWAAASMDWALASSGLRPATGSEYGANAASFTDAQLMQRFGNGDGGAFRALYLRYRDRLYRYALRLASSPIEADEIFQDVWLAVIHGRARYRPTAKFVTYLFTIAHRRMTDALRRRGRWGDETEAVADVEQMADEISRQPQEMALLAEDRDILNAAIERLPLAQREAFLLQVEGEMTLEEIAEAVQAGRETVKSRLRYAYARLRRDLEKVP